ncbi:IS110 family transposase [Petrotoga olearia]|uniref:Transposase n=2 Tax=Petrotoga olearia TaxID=156203 RepID=A0A2K1P123_9BACT|nr:transposase [Petrotoga olearia DSM 13574]
MNYDVLSTLFVGVDVSSLTNTVCAIDFQNNKLLDFDTKNNRIGAEYIAEAISNCLVSNNLDYVVIALEATSFYSTHIANFLSTNKKLLPFKPLVYQLNPKTTANYKKTFVDIDKTDHLDAYVIADFARCGKISSSPWRGSQFLALQRLTRHRFHLVQTLVSEKNWMLSNIYLKFSELAVNEDSLTADKDKPFSDIYGATSCAVLTEFYSLDEIVYKSINDLTQFVIEKSKNRFKDPTRVATLLKQAAKNSYRLDKMAYEPLNIAISSSLNVIKALEKEIETVDKAIEKTVKGLNPIEYQSLISVKGIGPVISSGIISEIGTIASFRSHDKLAKFAGLTWRKRQSGNYSSDETEMTKTGNPYLRYYFIEAASSVKNYIPEFEEYYWKKYYEVTTHQHKRALALTARKLVRMIFALLSKNRIYSNY